MLQFRRHTIDRMIFNAINYADEYRLPEAFDADDIILDIGTHAGYFAHRALKLGAGKVIGVEAEKENYELARQNLKAYLKAGRAELVFGAVWRSDENEDVLYHSGHTHFPNHHFVNSGGGDVLWSKSGEPLPKLAFDELLLQITENGKKNIRLLKLDCEGSEWPILLTSQHLHLVEEVCGEYHEIGGEFDDLETPSQWKGHKRFTESLMVRILESKGFSVNVMRHINPVTEKKERLGMFFAKRQNHIFSTS